MCIEPVVQPLLPPHPPPSFVQSLKIVTTTLDMSHPENAETLGGQLQHLGGKLDHKLEKVKQKIPAEIVEKIPVKHISFGEQVNADLSF